MRYFFIIFIAVFLFSCASGYKKKMFGFKIEYNGETIKVNDKRSFKILAKHYAKDKTTVYFGGRVIPDSDPKTFEIISKRYSKDKNSVYYCDY